MSQAIADKCNAVYESVLHTAKEGPSTIDAIVKTVAASLKPTKPRCELASKDPTNTEFMLRAPDVVLSVDGRAKCRLEITVYVETKSKGLRSFDVSLDLSVWYSSESTWHVMCAGWSNDINIGRDPSAHAKCVERIVSDVESAAAKSALIAAWDTVKTEGV